MNTLIELSVNLAGINAQLEALGGEMSQEVEQQLTVISQQLSEKIDDYYQVLRYAKARVVELKSIEEQVYSAKKATDKAVARIKERIKMGMDAMNVSELSGERVRFLLSDSAPSLVIDDEKLIPDEFKTQIVSFELNRDLLKKHLLAGARVPGAHIEVGKTLRDYFKK